MGFGGETKLERIVCTVEEVEEVAENDRTEGHESPICGKPADAECFGYNGRKTTKEKAITHCGRCCSASPQAQTIWMMGDQLTSSDARNGDKHVRIFGTNRAKLGDAENCTRDDEAPISVHVKPFDYDI